MGISIIDNVFALLQRNNFWLANQGINEGIKVWFGSAYNYIQRRSADSVLELVGGGNGLNLKSTGGIYFGAPTGGAPGSEGVVNAEGYQKDGVEIAGASAWVDFNGTGAVTINDSLNVSSITDVGVGHYQINIASSLANNNYCVVANHVETVGLGLTPAGWGSKIPIKSTSYFRITTGGDGTTSAVMADPENVCAAVFGGI